VTIRFIDSLRFLNSSLNNLVTLLPSIPLTDTIVELPSYARRSKGVFPYSLADSVNALEQPRSSFPQITEFRDSLSGGAIKVSVEEHARAARIWADCKCQSLKEYMLIYLKLDVYLLADVFESFRKTAIAEDNLDPANFFTIPGLSWCSALKRMTSNGYQLHLLQDSMKFEFFENGVTGGMTFVNTHHALNDSEHDSLLYIDINNLYGWALSQPLPMSDFEWVEDVEEFDLTKLPADDAESGFVFELDLFIPPHLHDKLSDLPPAPRMAKPPGHRVEKLLLTLEPKSNYVIHYALLKFYLELGVQVTKIHRAISFKQAAFFADYIQYNTTKRAASSDKFQKDYYKLKNNSLFGKTVENLRKRMNLRLCNTAERLMTYTSKPTFKRSIVVDDDLVSAILSNESICLDRPVYVGQAVLDLSKLRMYRLQYVELEKYRQQFACKIDILAGDTDSFFLKCTNVSVGRQLLPAMKEDGLLDTSNYPTDHPLYSNLMANRIGLFKDESAGVATYLEWIFLRPKCYSLLTTTSNVKKAKGITYNVVKSQLSHDDYRKIYESLVFSGNDDDDDDDGDGSVPQPPPPPPPVSSNLSVSETRILSRNHQLYTVRNQKVALSAMDNKRVWTESNQSLPYGHYRLTSS
jgi:hypothetical protein